MRVGLDYDYTPISSDFIMLGARLIGFSFKFRPLAFSHVLPGEVRLFTDATSCEEATFTAPNPFTAMRVYVNTGVTISQTQTLELTTVWGADCGYSYSVSPAETWLSHSWSLTN